jgi:hypothetical protein
MAEAVCRIKITILFMLSTCVLKQVYQKHRGQVNDKPAFLGSLFFQG